MLGVLLMCALSVIGIAVALFSMIGTLVKKMSKANEINNQRD
ncbi:hypothetical protein [Metabacillus iocasae]|uniref:Outer membrane lipoprotein n=1 Tax=Priestia iocasae TaxID=2291674 RepID=A0ABS2QRQ0_9BACI|nr:hypothetical protein [Metabacillus iocasae]MBM7702150.1 putative outer membrane lipoprotein [Metabacillus iocasae]